MQGQGVSVVVMTGPHVGLVAMKSSRNYCDVPVTWYVVSRSAVLVSKYQNMHQLLF